MPAYFTTLIKPERVPKKAVSIPSCILGKGKKQEAECNDKENNNVDKIDYQVRNCILKKRGFVCSCSPRCVEHQGSPIRLHWCRNHSVKESLLQQQLVTFREKTNKKKNNNIKVTKIPVIKTKIEKLHFLLKCNDAE